MAKSTKTRLSVTAVIVVFRADTRSVSGEFLAMWGHACHLSWNDIVEYDCLLNFNYSKEEEESEIGSSIEPHDD